MNGKELFESRTKDDIKEMAKYLYEYHECDYESVDDIEDEIYYFLNIIKDVQLIKDKEDDDFVVIVKKVKDDFYDEVEMDENGEIDFSKVPDYYIVDGIHVKELLENKDILDDTYEKHMKKDRKFITTYGIEFVERPRLLGFEIMDLCFEKEDINRIAAEIYYEYTFNGVTDQSQSDRKEELDARVKEVEELMELVKEHPEKKDEVFPPAKDIFSDLDEESVKVTKRDMDIYDKIAKYNFEDRYKFYKEYLEKYGDKQTKR